MTDHANELRRYSRKIGQPAGDVPSVMLAAADEIERLAAMLEAAEKERDNANAAAAGIALQAETLQAERDTLRAELAQLRKEADKFDDGIDWIQRALQAEAKIEAMEKQKPVGVLHVGSYYGEELQDWEFEANQCACDKLNEAYVSNPTSLPLYAGTGIALDARIDAMLAAAPEAKP